MPHKATQLKATQLKAQTSQQATPKSSRLPAGNKTSQQAKELKERPSCAGHCLANPLQSFYSPHSGGMDPPPKLLVRLLRRIVPHSTRRGFCLFVSQSVPYLYSNGTNAAGGAYSDTAQDFLPSSFCPKRMSTCLFVPAFWGKIPYGPFTQLNLLLRLFLKSAGHLSFPLKK